MSTVTLSFKGKTLKVYLLKEGETFIGSDPSCGVFIDSLAVQPRHASITTSGASSVIRDLGSPDGITVGGKKVAEQTLKNDDVIGVGKHELHFELATAAAENEGGGAKEEESFAIKRPNKRTAWLQLLTGNNVGKTISLNRNMTNLGKPGVQTAVISRRNDGYFITHLEGPKPPTIDGVSIGNETVELADGNVIQIGNVKMQFSLE